MKKQYVSLVVIILSLGAIYTSCNDKLEKRGDLKFKHIKVDEKIHMFNDTAKPACNLSVDFMYITNSSDNLLKDSLNRLLIEQVFGAEYVGDDINGIAKQYKDNYISDYRQDLEPMFIEDQKNKDNEDMVASWYSYSRRIETTTQFYEKDLLIYQIYFDEYTGGAHGTYRYTYLNIDLESMKVLTLDEIFVEGYEEILAALLWNQLMIDNNANSREELEDMGYGLTGDLMSADEFYLDKEGITFFYNVYEFAPYVMGPVKIKLLYSEMDGLMEANKIISQIRH